MVCPFCASTNIASIKGQSFCVNCGRQIAKTKTGGKGKSLAAAQAAVDIEVKKILKPADKITAKPAVKTSETIKASTKSPMVSRFSTGSKSSDVRVNVQTKTEPKVVAQTTKSVDIMKPKPAPAGPAKSTVMTKPTISDIKRPTPKARTEPVKEKPKQKPKHRRKARRKAKKAAAAAAMTTAARPATVAGPKAEPAHAHETAVSLGSSSVIRTGNLVAALVLTSLLTAKVVLLHISQASTPGGFFRYLSTVSSSVKHWAIVLSPAYVLLVMTLALIIIWMRAASIFATAKMYDHRKISPGVAYRAGWNSLASLLVLSLLQWLVAGLWLTGVVTAIKGLSGLSLADTQTTLIGVGLSFAMVLIGLYLAVGIIMARYLIILSGQSFARSLGQAFTLTHRRFVTLATSVLGLALGLAGMTAAVGTVLTLVARWIHQQQASIWILVGLSLALVFALSWWFWRWSLGVLMRLYRTSTRLVFGDHQTVNYHGGRRPGPISAWGVVISVSWWLLVTSAACYGLWRWRFDPTPLLKHLATTIY